MSTNNNKDIFIDGLGRIAMYAGTVRLQLVSLVPNDNKDPKTNREVNGKTDVVMSIQGFLNMFGAMKEFTSKLEEKEVIVKKDKKAN